MNTKAQQLGLINTKFSNPHGLQNAMNLSTAKDIIILSQYASNNAKFREVMNKDTYGYHYYEPDERFLERSLMDVNRNGNNETNQTNEINETNKSNGIINEINEKT